ncbi:THUMPD3, partial [Symbiodinium pilosum]
VRHLQLCCLTTGLQRLVPPKPLASDRSYLLLYTRGLEDQAEALLFRTLAHTVPTWRIPPPQHVPRVSEGHAAVGKLLVRLPDGEQIPQEGIPGIIHTYAFVDAVTGLSDEKEVAIEQLSKWVAGLGPALLQASQLVPGGATIAPTFRASAVRDGEHHFTSEDAMAAVGYGVGSAVSWKANMKSYDIE